MRFNVKFVLLLFFNFSHSNFHRLIVKQKIIWVKTRDYFDFF